MSGWLWRCVMGVEQFRDDDSGYLGWVAAHGDGYVINIQRSLNPAEARMHKAGCYTINGQPPRGRPWSGQHVDIGSTALRQLAGCAVELTGSPRRRRGVSE